MFKNLFKKNDTTEDILQEIKADLKEIKEINNSFTNVSISMMQDMRRILNDHEDRITYLEHKIK